jgi:UV excision repair protein RAD23
MKVILKTLKQVPYELNFESDEITVETLKALTESTHNIEADSIKLVFNGVVLKNECTLKSYNILEGNVIILMITKTKVINKPVEKVEEKKDEKKEEKVEEKVEKKAEKVEKTEKKVEKVEKDYTSEIATLVDMGFPKDYSETAIKAAKGNVTIAIEYLYNGIPEVPVNNQQAQSSQNSEEDESNPLTIVRRIASIVKVLCANDPSQLQNIILSLQQTQPELIELIKQHESEFKTLIASPVSEEDIAAFQNFNSGIRGEGGQGLGGQGQGGQGGQGQGGPETIRLSKPEYDAIQRLKEFGFSEMDAAQAYFAMDKNEELALNFLFEMKGQEGFENNKSDNKDNKDK